MTVSKMHRMQSYSTSPFWLIYTCLDAFYDVEYEYDVRFLF